MNLVQYLMRPVTSLEDRQLEKRVYIKTPKPESSNQNRHNESLRRYRDVMEGAGWLTTIEITERVCAWNVEHGFRRIQDAFPTLNKWEKKYGYVERRTKDDGEKWGRRHREEWRWVE